MISIIHNAINLITRNEALSARENVKLAYPTTPSLLRLWAVHKKECFKAVSDPFTGFLGSCAELFVLWLGFMHKLTNLLVVCTFYWAYMVDEAITQAISYVKIRACQIAKSVWYHGTQIFNWLDNRRLIITRCVKSASPYFFDAVRVSGLPLVWGLVKKSLYVRLRCPNILLAVFVPLSVPTIFAQLSFLNNNWAQALVTGMVASIPLYLLWQTFTYFGKLYTSNKYTSYIGAYWNKTYVVFWTLEISLYCLFIYFWFISPEAPQAVIGQAITIRSVTISMKSCIKAFFMLAFIMIISIFTLIARNYHNKILTTIGFALLMPPHIILLRDEYVYFVYNCAEWGAAVKVFYTTELLGGNSTVLDGVKGMPDALVPDTLDLIKSLVYNRNKESVCAYAMYSIIWFLRFWHVLAIFFCFVFFNSRTVDKDSTSYEALATIFANAAVLVIFNLTYFIYYIKAVGKTMIVNSSEAYALDSEREWSYAIVIELVKLATESMG